MGWNFNGIERKIARRFRPDVMVARVGQSVGITGKLLGIPTVVYDDMEQARLQAAIGMTFATYICTGLGYYRNFGKRQVRFQGSPVLSYLAPNYFQPNPKLLQEAGINTNKPYIVIRLVSWSASHDVGRRPRSENELTSVIKRLSPPRTRDNQFRTTITSCTCPILQSRTHPAYSRPVSLCVFVHD